MARRGRRWTCSQFRLLAAAIEKLRGLAGDLTVSTSIIVEAGSRDQAVREAEARAYSATRDT